MPPDQPPPGAPPPRKSRPSKNGSPKPGFYAHRFRQAEASDLAQSSERGLEDEIQLLKVIIRRVFELAEDESQDNLENWIKVLSACANAMARQSTLLKAQSQLNGESRETVAQAISQAIAEVTDEITRKQ